MTIEKALKAIKSAYIAAVISATLTLIASLVAFAGHSFGGLISPWMFLDAVLIYVLALGLYKKSRICATLILLYWIAVKVLILVDNGTVGSIPVTLLFTYYFFMGVLGTFYYHKLVKPEPDKHTTEPVSTITSYDCMDTHEQQPVSACNSWRTS
ncbi:MAG: hypothetical protein ACYST2_05045 [Planctomycetota bacterium]|jgi:serine/threonine-protein kinase